MRAHDSRAGQATAARRAARPRARVLLPIRIERPGGGARCTCTIYSISTITQGSRFYFTRTWAPDIEAMPAVGPAVDGTMHTTRPDEVAGDTHRMNGGASNWVGSQLCFFLVTITGAPNVPHILYGQ